jgi:RNA polymerase sigma-B factor
VGSEEKATLGERIATEDDGPYAVDARVILTPAVKDLSVRDQRILYLRFFEGRNQREIGDEIGVTQMQVSRLLARILRDLRRSLDLQVGG